MAVPGDDAFLFSMNLTQQDLYGPVYGVDDIKPSRTTEFKPGLRLNSWDVLLMLENLQVVPYYQHIEHFVKLLHSHSANSAVSGRLNHWVLNKNILRCGQPKSIPRRLRHPIP